MSAHVRHVNRSTPPQPRQQCCNHTNHSSMPLLCHISDEYTRIFQTLQRMSRRHTYVTHQDIIQNSEKKQNFANCRLKERCDHNCVWENKKKKKNLMINRLWTDRYVLGKVVKKLSLVGDMPAQQVFYSGNWSQNDATWEKNNKTLVCCIKSTQELTLFLTVGEVLCWRRIQNSRFSMPQTHVLSKMCFFVTWETNVITIEQVPGRARKEYSQHCEQ